MLLRQLTPDDAMAVWGILRARYGTTVVQKADSRTMRLIASFLEQFGYMASDTFLRSYSTQLFRTIYVPFVVGGTDRAPDRQIGTAVHEHHHVHQLERDGTWTFTGQYLSDHSRRALYEAEALVCNMEWDNVVGFLQSPLAYAERLKNYGCSTADIQAVIKMLELELPMIMQGPPRRPTTRLAARLLRERGAIV